MVEHRLADWVSKSSNWANIASDIKFSANSIRDPLPL